jgi:hypothetical protein
VRYATPLLRGSRRNLSPRRTAIYCLLKNIHLDDDGRQLVHDVVCVSAGTRRLIVFGSNNISVAEANSETPATAKPPYKLPVLWLIQPVAYGPAKPPRFASELTKAIPEAAANPVRKSPGSE